MSERSGGAAGQSRAEGEGGRTAGGSAGMTAVGGTAGIATAGGTAGTGGSAGSVDNGGDAGSDAQGGAAGNDAIGGDAGTAGVIEVPACDGCKVGSTCVADKLKDPANPCQICDVSRSRTGYSANLGATCGASATECSAQDTCDDHAVCQKNDLVTGTHCATGGCVSGACQASPFDCIVPSPPVTTLPDQIYSMTGTPPAPAGGTIADGKYVPSRVDLYNSEATGIDVRTFEFKSGFVQAAARYFSIETHGAFIPEVQFAGTVTSSANTLKFVFERCDPQYNIDVPNLSYTGTANGMVTTEKLSDGSTIVTSYKRQ